MSEMVERCAAALADIDRVYWLQLVEEKRDVYRRRVKSVIAEMRAPTKEMRAAMWLAPEGACECWWQLGIDEALK